MRKNIYIPDSMQHVVDRFEKAGGNFSEVCQKALTDWVDMDNASKGGMGRVEVVVRTGLRDVIQVFTGRCLVKDFQVKPALSFPKTPIETCLISVFQTARGKIAVYKRKSGDVSGTLEIRDSIEQADMWARADLSWDTQVAIAAAAKKLPTEKQELDI